jgi:multidrug resistance protein, MATE family
MSILSERNRALLKESWLVSWPMTLIMFSDFLIGITDIFVAGRISKEIQAAYGVAFQVYFIFFTIAMAFTVGTVSVVSRLYNSSGKDSYRCAVYSSLVSTGVFGCIFGIIGFFAGPLVVSLLHIPVVVKNYAVPMLRIYAAALVFDYLLLNSNAILRSSKKIIVSLRTMCIVSVLNIVLNFVLAFHTPMGYLGIAVASAVSLLCGVIINVFPVRSLLENCGQFSLAVVREMIGIGWPMALLQFSWQGATIVLYTILGGLPVDPVGTMAAFTNGVRLESAVFLPAFAFNMANAVIVGNLIGQKRTDDAYHNGIVTACLGAALVAGLTVIVIAFAPRIMPALTTSPSVAKAGIIYLRIAFLSEPLMAWGVILAGGLSGAGDTRRIMMIVVLSVWVVRIPLAYFMGLRFGFGPAGIWWAMNASILVQSFFMTRRYFSRRWFFSLPSVQPQ